MGWKQGVTGAIGCEGRKKNKLITLRKAGDKAEWTYAGYEPPGRRRGGQKRAWGWGVKNTQTPF